MSKKTISLTIAIAISFVGVANQACYPHGHTHIGRNQDQIWGNADDDRLWFFSMPGTAGWPNWAEPLELEPQGIYDEGKQLYKCEALYCWHSAHPQHGNWQLGGADEGTPPQWNISLKRVGFDNDFFMLDENEQFVLAFDGDQRSLPQLWMADKYNENGTFGAWGFHTHLWFYAWADGPGQTFNATFQALDCGTTGLTASDNYTMTFETVPEPSAVCLLALAAATLRRRRRNQAYS